MTAATSITVRVPLTIRHQPGRKTVVTPMTDGVAAVTTRAHPVLVKALARAFRYQRMLDQERYVSISKMAAAERIERVYLDTLVMADAAGARYPEIYPGWAGFSKRRIACVA